MTPCIEILTVRDPDQPTDVRLFVDGVETAPATIVHVDPGAGYFASDWDAETATLAADTQMTAAFKDAVLEARTDGRDSEHVTEAATPDAPAPLTAADIEIIDFVPGGTLDAAQNHFDVRVREVEYDYLEESSYGVVTGGWVDSNGPLTDDDDDDTFEELFTHARVAAENAYYTRVTPLLDQVRDEIFPMRADGTKVDEPATPAEPYQLVTYDGEDGVPVIQIDTLDDTTRVRVNINDAPVFDMAPGTYVAGDNTQPLPEATRVYLTENFTRLCAHAGQLSAETVAHLSRAIGTLSAHPTDR